MNIMTTDLRVFTAAEMAALRNIERLRAAGLHALDANRSVEGARLLGEARRVGAGLGGGRVL